MDTRSEFTTTHPDGCRLSTSLSHQSWATLSSSLSSGPTSASTISPQARYRHGETALDESTLAQRTTALRQLNGNPRPLSRRPRDSKPLIPRPSTLASQPVLVRSYSDDAPETRLPSIMPSDSISQRVPNLPSVQDFSIESILRAIEPDIRSTLESIAEICGRSKLSLANEYGSHIAPFGEIRASLGGLLTVEEASASSERLADDNVVIVDDDNSVLDSRDLFGSTAHGLLENLQQAAFATGYQQAPRFSHGDSPSQGQSEGSRASNENSLVTSQNIAQITPASLLPVTKEFSTKPKPAGRDLLGRRPQSVAKTHAVNMATSATLSETHLDARANRSSWPSVPLDVPRGSPTPIASQFPHVNRNRSFVSQTTGVDKYPLIADVQDWLNWLKTVVQSERKSQQAYRSIQHSAETTLRAVLERHSAGALQSQEQTVEVT